MTADGSAQSWYIAAFTSAILTINETRPELYATLSLILFEAPGFDSPLCEP